MCRRSVSRRSQLTASERSSPTLTSRSATHETIAIVGESGSGKSMTAKAITGLLPARVMASGDVIYRGQNLLRLKERQLQRVRGNEIGLIMQDPFTMLNPLMRCGRHITELLRDRDGKKLSRRASAPRRFAVLRRSGSMTQTWPAAIRSSLSGRHAPKGRIAAALALDPQLLIADEPSTALDVTDPTRNIGTAQDIERARGMAMILITHDLRLAFSLCDRIYVLYAGSLVEVGPGSDVLAQPLHPYTLGLLLSEPAAIDALRNSPRSVVLYPGQTMSPPCVRSLIAVGGRRHLSVRSPTSLASASGSAVRVTSDSTRSSRNHAQQEMKGQAFMRRSVRRCQTVSSSLLSGCQKSLELPDVDALSRHERASL